ncbi:MAG: hypothetical protein NXI31_07555 [bacterium]|nr:hypothetical protein [bacterium]
MSDERLDEVVDRFVEVELRRGARQPDLAARVTAQLAGHAPQAARRGRLLAAAAILIGVSVLIGVQWLASSAGRREACAPVAWSLPHDPPRDVKDLEQVRALPVGVTSVRGWKLDATAITELRRLKDLRYLELREPTPATGLLAQLAEFRTLQALVIHRVQPVGDLAPLAELPNLQRLAVRYAKVENADLGALADCPALEELDLAGNRDITAEGIAAIARVSGLRRLQLADRVLVPIEPEDPGDRPTEARRRVAMLAGLSDLQHLGVHVVDESDYGEEGGLAGLAMPEFGHPTIGELAKLGHLQSLAVVSKDLDDEALTAIGAMPELRSLVIGSAPEVTYEGLAALGPDLRHLHIESCGAIHGELPKNLRSLESFTASWCRHLSDVSVASLAGAPLERLSLRYCASLTPKCLTVLASWPLEELDLAGLPWVGDDELQRIARLPKLARLELSSTRDLWKLVISQDPFRNRQVGGGNAITGKGFAALAGARGLRFLSLAGLGELAVEDLQPLGALRLERLDLRGVELGADAAATLVNARGLWPDVDIIAGDLEHGTPTDPRFRR